MRTFIQLSCIIALSVSLPPILPPRNNEYINDMLDLVDSGMNSPAEGRALFVSITLTSTSTSIATVTVNSTVTNSCVSGTFTECTSTTSTSATTTDSASTTTSATASATTTDTASTTTSASATTTDTASTTTSATSTASTTDTASTTTSATASATTTDTATTTSTDTATTTSTDTTTTASTRAVELERSLDFNDFPNAIVTASNGQYADISSILPTRVQMNEARNDNPVGMYNVDGIITEDQNMQSGKMEWKEMAVQGLHSCGRSNNEKRPRFIALAQETVAKNLTSTITSTVTATSTVTFSVQLPQCTTAGFTFAVPSC